MTVLLWILIILFFPVIFLCITQWIVNNKANRPGWHVLIPFLNVYTRAKFSGTTKYFWIYAVCSLVSSYISNMSDVSTIILLIAIATAIAAFVAFVQIEHGVARVFGKENGFGVGLVLLPLIFYPILAFGGSKYNPELINKQKD